MKTKILSVVGLMCVLIMGGCGSRLHEGVADTVDDDSLVASVRSILEQDPNLSKEGIQVISNNGVIKLSGVVDSAIMALKAEERVSEIAGVKGVKNKLRVRY
ncbi:MAG: BON domain-containing protein [Caedimonadaceae bacterium]|nr:MAG: BON domain-containing protein [Caedimonadaceae bacterium]